jgi:cell division protein FtsB
MTTTRSGKSYSQSHPIKRSARVIQLKQAAKRLTQQVNDLKNEQEQSAPTTSQECVQAIARMRMLDEQIVQLQRELEHERMRNKAPPSSSSDAGVIDIVELQCELEASRVVGRRLSVVVHQLQRELEEARRATEESDAALRQLRATTDSLVAENAALRDAVASAPAQRVVVATTEQLEHARAVAETVSACSAEHDNAYDAMINEIRRLRF